LTNLQQLDIKHNEVAYLPPEMGYLIQCSKMDLSHNMITEVPWEFGELENTLNILDISHNPVVIPPKPEINKGVKAMLGWLKKNEKEGRKAKVSGLGLKS